ncbi:hypothetical protein C4M98_03750 [Mycoplasmopsis pullorum]|nr:hypothetical protein C4M83_01010 [Mycoplasmopsis pullorum]TNK94962.1 hypothetical protein C4M98_03750 [Mycoplasmopsis pullorum]
MFLGFKIFIAEDLILKSKSTHFKSVVKSSKIITGFSLLEWKMFSSSSVYPKMNFWLAVKTGILNSELYLSLFTINFVGWI